MVDRPELRGMDLDLSRVDDEDVNSLVGLEVAIKANPAAAVEAIDLVTNQPESVRQYINSGLGEDKSKITPEIKAFLAPGRVVTSKSALVAIYTALKSPEWESLRRKIVFLDPIEDELVRDPNVGAAQAPAILKHDEESVDNLRIARLKAYAQMIAVRKTAKVVRMPRRGAARNVEARLAQSR